MLGMAPVGQFVDYAKPWVAASGSGVDTDNDAIFKIDLPAGRAVGDICIICTQQPDGNNAATPADGFVEWSNSTNGSNAYTQTFYKILDGSEPDTLNWGYNDQPTVRFIAYTTICVRGHIGGIDNVAYQGLVTGTSSLNPPTNSVTDARERFRVWVGFGISNRDHASYPNDLNLGRQQAFTNLSTPDVGVQQAATVLLGNSYNPGSFGIQGSTGQGRGATGLVW